MITSKSNNIVKHISSLNIKKYRDINNQYIVEGIKMVREIVNSEETVPEFIIYSRDLLRDTTIGTNFLRDFNNCMENWIEVSKEVFEYISDTKTPQGILSVLKKDVKYIDYLSINIKEQNNEKYIILESIQDQGNMGTIIRSAVAFDVKNIICTDKTVDIFSPKVIRSTMGCINKINVYIVSEEQIGKMVKLFNDNEYKLISTTLSAKKSLNEYNFSIKDVFVFGNEANGISEDFQKHCTSSIKIEMIDTVESLNVAIAASIVMYNWHVKKTEVEKWQEN